MVMRMRRPAARRLMCVVLRLCWLIALGGCFAEVAAGIAPGAHQTVTPAGGSAVERDITAYTLSLFIGFYLDLGNVGIAYAFPGTGGNGYVMSDGGVQGVSHYTQHWRADVDTRQIARMPDGHSLLLGATAIADFDTTTSVKERPNSSYIDTGGGGWQLFGGAQLHWKQTLALAVGLAYASSHTDAGAKGSSIVDASTLTAFAPQVRLTYHWNPLPFLQVFRFVRDTDFPKAQTSQGCTVHESVDSHNFHHYEGCY